MEGGERQEEKTAKRPNVCLEQKRFSHPATRPHDPESSGGERAQCPNRKHHGDFCFLQHTATSAPTCGGWTGVLLMVVVGWC